MNQQQNKWHVFGRWWLTTTELSTYIVMAIALIGGLVSLFPFGNIQYSVACLLLLLLAFVWYQVDATREVQKSLDEGKVEILKRSDDIFRRAQSTLKSGTWEKVRIYAPVGISDPSHAKTEWLTALKVALHSGNVGYFLAVYALPREKSSFDSPAKERLMLFKETPGTEVHYLPPDDSSHPTAAAGLGAIVFEDHDSDRYEAIFAFVGPASAGSLGRSGFVTQDKRVILLVADWFDAQIFHGCSQNYVLRGAGTDLETTLTQIERQYYLTQTTVA